MKTRTKRFLQNFVLLLTVIVLFLFFFEISLRVLGISSGYDYPRGMYKKDDLLGYSMTSNFAGKFVKPEFETMINTNSEGLRDVEYGKKGINEFRILAIGDSFTWGGYGTELEETYLKILENKLNRGGKQEFKVINAGVPGYGTKQEYLYLKERGINYEPDAVLLSFVLNDFVDNSVDLNSIIIKDGIKVTDSTKEGFLLDVRGFLLINFWSYRFFEKGLIGIFGKTVRKFINKDVEKDERLLKFFSKSSKDGEEVELTYGVLNDINSYLKNENISFVIILIPEKYQVDERLKKKFIEVNNLNLEYTNFMKPQGIIKEWVKRRGVMTVDLLPYLKEENKDNDFYWDLNPHFNKKGNERVAEIIFQELNKSMIVS